MAKYERHIKGQFGVILDRLQKDIEGSAMSMELVDESNCQIGDTRIAVRVYDKYFMRNSSRASLSLTVACHGDDIFVSAIGAGGGNGAFFNFSMGTEEEMVAIVQECLDNMTQEG